MSTTNVIDDKACLILEELGDELMNDKPNIGEISSTSHIFK
jgi:hypothetical protein